MSDPIRNESTESNVHRWPGYTDLALIALAILLLALRSPEDRNVFATTVVILAAASAVAVIRVRLPNRHVVMNFGVISALMANNPSNRSLPWLFIALAGFFTFGTWSFVKMSADAMARSHAGAQSGVGTGDEPIHR